MIKFSLKYRIAAIIFLLEAVMVLLVLYRSQEASFSAIRAQIEANDQVVLTMLSDLYRFAIITNEYKELQPYIEKIQQQPHVKRLYLTDYDNIVVASSEPGTLGFPLPNLDDSSNRYWRTKRLQNQTGLVGVLAIEFSNENILHAYATGRERGVTTGVVLMIVIALIGIFLAHLITRRLENLTIAANAMADGDLNILIDTSGSDEVSVLSQNFNRMTQKIKNTLEELQKSEERYGLAIKGSSDGVWDWPDLNKDEYWWSPRIFEMLGYTPDDFVPRISLWRELMHPEERDLVGAILQDHFEKHTPYDAEFRMQHKDGSYLWFHARGQAIFNSEGKAVRMSGSVQDITAKRIAEQALLQEKKQSQQYLDVAAVIIVAIGRDQKVKLINKQGCNLLGYPEKEIIGKDWFDHFLPKRLSHQVSKVFEQLITGVIKAEKYFENPVLTRSGEERLIAWHNNFTQDEEGNITGTIGSGVDITERKQAQEALRKAYDEMEQRVKERTQELRMAHEQLVHVEKLSAIGNLSASIAHEFNNPLAGITNVIHGLKKRATYDEDDAKLIDMAIGECSRIKNLIKSLQDFNRPSSGRAAPIDIHATIESLLLLSKKECQNKGITVETDYAEDMPQIKAVADQIKQVILNILNNAVYSCEGGGSIKINTQARSKNINIKIQDNGKGILPEDMDCIFDPFFTTKPEIKGTGLGLSISYGIIKKHGGRIDVKSEPGKGATFTITLPIEGVKNAE